MEDPVWLSEVLEHGGGVLDRRDVLDFMHGRSRKTIKYDHLKFYTTTLCQVDQLNSKRRFLNITPQNAQRQYA